jgi:hypothetical protein
MSLERFCRKPLVTIPPHQTVQDAAVQMRPPRGSDHRGGTRIAQSGSSPIAISPSGLSPKGETRGIRQSVR